MENWRLLIVSILVLTIIACAPRGQRTGVRLMEVVPYSPADNARLGVGDYIVEVSQTPVSTADQIRTLVEAARSSGKDKVLILVEGASGGLRFIAINSTIGLQGIKFFKRK